MDYYLAKRDLVTFTHNQLKYLAKYLHLDTSLDKNDLAWMIALKLHSQRGTMIKAKFYRLGDLLKTAKDRGDALFPSSVTTTFITEFQNVLQRQTTLKNSLKGKTVDEKKAINAQINALDRQIIDQEAWKDLQRVYSLFKSRTSRC